MPLILSTLSALRRDPRIQHLPPYLSILCVLIGILWLSLLPLDEYSRRTYISENALLPGQVHTYFRGSEQDIFNAHLYDVTALTNSSYDTISAHLQDALRTSGLKTATQRYRFSAAGQVHEGENVYGILQAPRGDATEAMVLMAPWINMQGQLNRHGVALTLTLARYFKRWSLWSKDIIIVITPDSRAGPEAWVSAYHDSHDAAAVAALPLKSGALEGAIIVDNHLDHHFKNIHVIYDGINGQLPNLDLINTAVSVASGQHGMGAVLQEMWTHADSYRERLRTIFRGMLHQGIGHPTGAHGCFLPYHVDAITVQAQGEGWEDDMAMGRVVESLFRSLNNLMEHFHQSFFLYLLLQTNRFVSIGTYLPSAMLLSASFTIMALSLWIASGRPPVQHGKGTSTAVQDKAATSSDKQDDKSDGFEVLRSGDDLAIIPRSQLVTVDRPILWPASLVLIMHLLGLVPLYLLNHLPSQLLQPAFWLLLAVASVLSFTAPTFITLGVEHPAPSTQQLMLLKCFSLLLLGMYMATLATVNFSLSFLVGLFCAPLSLIGCTPTSFLEENEPAATAAPFRVSVPRRVQSMLLLLVSPPSVFLAACTIAGIDLTAALEQASFGWHVWGVWTQVIIWCVWWPAWLTAAIGLNLQTPDRRSIKL